MVLGARCCSCSVLGCSVLLLLGCSVLCPRCSCCCCSVLCARCLVLCARCGCAWCCCCCLGARCCVLGARCCVPGAPRSRREPRCCCCCCCCCSVLGARCCVLGAGCFVLGVGCPGPHAGTLLPDNAPVRHQCFALAFAARPPRLFLKFGTAAAWRCHSPQGVSMEFVGASRHGCKLMASAPRLLEPQSRNEHKL